MASQLVAVILLQAAPMVSNEQPHFYCTFLKALGGATIGGLIAVLLLALFADGTPQSPTFVQIGMFSLFSLMTSLLVGVWVALLHGVKRPASISKLLLSRERRMRVLLFGPALIVAWVTVGQLSLRILSAFEARPVVGGVLLASCSLGVFTFSAWAVDRLAVFFVGRLPDVSLQVGLTVLFLVVFIIVPSLVFTGETSGLGAPWELFGVFRRPELNLTPVAQALLVGIMSYLCGMLALRKRGAWAIALGAATVCVYGAGLVAAARMEFSTALGIERNRGIPAISLQLFRVATDRDGDGFSPLFAGADCDDYHDQIYPGAHDVADNGVDEDCSGADRRATAGPDGKLIPKQGPPAARATARQLPEKANLLLLTIDTLRADLGYSRKVANEKLSPHLDALAKRSVVYQNAYSLASYTSKSVPPMLIGRYASETKRTFEHFDRFAKDIPFVQERLQSAGVRTTSVQGYWYFFFKGYGLERGWDELDSSAAPRVVAVEGDKNSNGHLVAKSAIEKLEQLAQVGDRFFMWTHWVDPHAEYVKHDEFTRGSSPRERYDGEVSFVDAQVGKVLAALERLSLDKSTVVIVTSDHGEAFGEHGMIRHGFELWEELVRVPLIVHIPAIGAKDIVERRSLIDLTATILENFDLPVSNEGDLFIRGTSLYRDILGVDGADIEKRPVLVDMPAGPHNQERRAFLVGDMKLITTRGRAIGLYNLREDPTESNDLSKDKELTESVRQKMNQYLDGLRPIKPRR